ncbi:hypothetical protein [Pedobacter insulae]|uniref:hypothetical protein n=1 Tax=Pedobacter insulae TaxID=414048 RepID=UPI00116042FD|nr:hypothetical protein [Pedobacter insulae]
MGKKAILTVFLLIIFFSFSFAQTGCRRNSDGVLFQKLIIFSSDYDAYQPYGDVSDFCLPPGISGTPCRIRIPLTPFYSNGTYGTYSLINCDLDGHAYLIIVSSILFGVWIRSRS